MDQGVSITLIVTLRLLVEELLLKQLNLRSSCDHLLLQLMESLLWHQIFQKEARHGEFEPLLIAAVAECAFAFWTSATREAIVELAR